ncbi:MAG TPA: indolepyruvate oxidoreductase subunit beta [Dysgonamonadaceae bacterium]|nr:indolepyruvate oxidoreductase subunit beta [Dysgonamonadaceae bacterium]
MHKNVILAGIGGQGILTLAAIIDHAAMQSGLYIKQAEVHGMSQRGGAVQSHLRISDKDIYSDLIPKGKADMILSLELMESLRYLPYLSKDGIIITATETVKNITDYPEEELIIQQIKDSGFKHVFIDANKTAKEAGSARTENVVMIGVASKFLGIEKEEFQNSLKTLFANKGDDIVALNLRAFDLGEELAIEL